MQNSWFVTALKVAVNGKTEEIAQQLPGGGKDFRNIQPSRKSS
jgi:hypothetical protein